MEQSGNRLHRSMLEAELWEMVSRAKETGVVHERDLKALLQGISLEEAQFRAIVQKLESLGIRIIPEEEGGSLFYPRMEELEEWFAGNVTVTLYLAELKKTGITRCLPREEEEVLSHRCAQDKTAADALTEGNLLRVVSLARQYMGQGMVALDLMEAGNRGLMDAVQSYRAEDGVPFLLWTVCKIRRAIQEGLDLCIREFRISEEAIREVLKLRKESRKKPNTTPDRLLPEDLEALLDLLTPREAAVIRMRIGMDDGQPHSKTETAEHFGITPERVHQIERKALRKIHIRRRNYRDLFGTEESQNFPQETPDETAPSGETEGIGEIIW